MRVNLESLIIQCADRLGVVEPIWRALHENGVSSPYQHFDWVEGIFSHIPQSPQTTLCIVTLHDPDCDGDVVALLPMIIRNLAGARVLMWLGDPHSNHQGGIFSQPLLAALSKQPLTSLWRRITDTLPRHDLVWLRSQFAELGDVANPFLKVPNPIRGANQSPQLIFPHHEWSKLAPTLRSKKARKRMRNEENRLGREADIQWHFVEKVEELHRFVPELFRQRHQRFLELGVKPEANEARYQTLYEQMLMGSRDKKDAVCRMLVLTADDEMIAGMILFQWQQRLYPLLISMTDGPLRQWSPGDYILRLALRYACENKMERVDMGPGDQEYKSAWCNHSVPLFENVSGRTLKGKVLALLIRHVMTAKRVIKTTPWLWSAYGRVRKLKSTLSGD